MWTLWNRYGTLREHYTDVAGHYRRITALWDFMECCRKLWNITERRRTLRKRYGRYGSVAEPLRGVTVHYRALRNITRVLRKVTERYGTITELCRASWMRYGTLSLAVCKSAPHPRQIATPGPHHSVFTGWMPFLLPNQWRQSIEGTEWHNEHHKSVHTSVTAQINAIKTHCSLEESNNC